jgi:uncharacterized protein (TIGR03435 family)
MPQRERCQGHALATRHGNRTGHPAHRWLVLAAVCLTSGGAVAAAWQQRSGGAVPPTVTNPASQSGGDADADPAFDIVSVRRNTESEEKTRDLPPVMRPPSQVTLTPGRMIGSGLTLRELVREAYGFRRRAPSDVKGGPAWVDEERYDIEGRTSLDFGPSVPGALPPTAEGLLRKLLADRFALRVRRQTETKDIYALMLARKDGQLGPSLRPASGKCLGLYAPIMVNETGPRGGGGGPAAIPRCEFVLGGGRGLTTGNMTMAEFATFLAGFGAIDRTVIDRTGLPGSYDVRMTQFQGGAAGSRTFGQSDVPTVFAALEQQLGLKLEKTRGPVEILEIESAQRPPKN